MTTVFTDPVAPPPGAARCRALIVGAGRYDHAKSGGGGLPILPDLSSVAFSVRTFVRRLIVDWRADLAAPLGTVDLLLSSADVEGACQWEALGVAGEVAGGTPIDTPTLPNLKQAMARTLDGSTAADTLIMYFCGHGFWKTQLHLFLSDFGSAPLAGWDGVVNLDGLKSGLRAMPPRTQWIFQDCCSELAQPVFDLIDPNVGDPIIRPSARALIAANDLGPLTQFGPASSSPGSLAFGEPGKPTRFAEMLIEALDGAGAVSRPDNRFWRVSNLGINLAMETFSRRHIDLPDPKFYDYTRPAGADAGTIYFRRVVQEPRSCYIGVAVPASKLRNAKVRITSNPSGQIVLDTPAVGRHRLKQELPARKDFDVEIVFENGRRVIDTIFSNLPLAEPEEARFEAEGADA